MVYPIYLLLLSIFPGLIWLFYFLQKDVHPEPKRMIIMVFILGMLVAPLAAIIECVPVGLDVAGKTSCALSSFFTKNFPHPLGSFLYFLLGVALTEELVKYAVIRFKILKSSELDEPMDLILYMIIAGLGFATLENIFIFFSPDIFPYTLQETFSLAVFRFLSATFLHALCSGTIGFFLALSFCEIKMKKLLLPAGLAMAVLLHGLYNFSIMNLRGELRFGIPLIILTGLAIFITLGIKKLKN